MCTHDKVVFMSCHRLVVLFIQVSEVSLETLCLTVKLSVFLESLKLWRDGPVAPVEARSDNQIQLALASLGRWWQYHQRWNVWLPAASPLQYLVRTSTTPVISIITLFSVMVICTNSNRVLNTHRGSRCLSELTTRKEKRLSHGCTLQISTPICF